MNPLKIGAIIAAGVTVAGAATAMIYHKLRKNYF